MSEFWEYSYDLADQLESIAIAVGAEYECDAVNRLRQVKVEGDVIMRHIYDAEGIRRLSKDDNSDRSRFSSSGGMSLADQPPGAELRAHSFIGGLGQRNEGGGLDYARQRWYDPVLGRWLSADPIGFSGGLNLYIGMGNNPVNFVDPSGLIELYPDETLYPSEELKAFRKEYNWPNCTTVLMHNQIEWENNPWNQNTLHILRGRPMFPGRRIGTGRPNVGYPSGRVNSRPLLPSDMNFRGTPNILNGRVTEPLKGGTYRVHVDMMDGTIANPYRTIPQLAGAARRAGAGSLECSGTFANERLMNFVEKSGGKITTTITDRGPVDSFRIELP